MALIYDERAKTRRDVPEVQHLHHLIPTDHITSHHIKAQHSPPPPLPLSPGGLCARMHARPHRTRLRRRRCHSTGPDEGLVLLWHPAERGQLAVPPPTRTLYKRPCPMHIPHGRRTAPCCTCNSRRLRCSGRLWRSIGYPTRQCRRTAWCRSTDFYCLHTPTE